MSTTDTVIVADTGDTSHSYMEWAPVFAGAAVASALSLVLFAFGGGLGLTISSPFSVDGLSAKTVSYLGMAYVLFAMIFSFIAGGYIAGRLRRPVAGASVDAVEFRDGAHGLTVWATGLLLGAFIAASAATGAVNSRAAIAVNAGEAAVMLRGGDDIDANDRDALAGVLARAAADGEIDENDRAIAVDIIADNTDLSETDARQRFEQWEVNAAEAAKNTRAVGAIGAFLMAASALIAGAAAYFAAGIGGRHRDANAPFPWTRAR